MVQALFYSSNAVAMTLAAGVLSGDTTCNLSSTSGLPASFPFKLLIGWGTAQQEVVHCTALSGVVATITRGQDGTTAQAHSIGAPVVHGVSAREFNDLELHVGSSAAVHGITGSVVGTTDTQTLTNKTFDATSNVSGAPIVGTTTAQTLTNKTLTGSVLNAATTGGVGAVVQAISGQTGNLQEWQALGGGVQAEMNQFGSLALQGPGSGAGYLGRLTVYTANTGLIGAVVQGVSGQLSSLQEWQNNSGTPLAKIDAAGNIFATNLTNAWTAYTPTLVNFPGTVNVARYYQVGKTVTVSVTITLTGAATGVMGLTLPTSYASGYTANSTLGSVLGQNGTTAAPGSVVTDVVSGATRIKFISAGTTGAWAAASPFTWASGHVLSFTVTYETP